MVAVPKMPTATADVTSEDFFDDLTKFRVAPDFGQAGVKKHLVSIPIGKPGPKDWFRVRPEDEYRSPFCLLTYGDKEDVYFVVPAVAQLLPGRVANFMLYTVMTRQNVLRLWPVRQADADGRMMECHRTAHQAADMAMEQWTCIVWNGAAKAYDLYTAQAQLDEPRWPEYDFNALLKVAFRERIIRSPDHIVVKQLLGLA
jgi:hypothetical protein